MLASVLLRLARIYGDDELERRAVSVFRLVHRAGGRVLAFGWVLSALDLHFSPPHSLRSSARPTVRSRRPHWRGSTRGSS